MKQLKVLLENVPEDAEIVVESEDSGVFRRLKPIWVQKAYFAADRGLFYEGDQRNNMPIGDRQIWVFE